MRMERQCVVVNLDAVSRRHDEAVEVGRKLNDAVLVTADLAKVFSCCSDIPELLEEISRLRRAEIRRRAEVSAMIDLDAIRRRSDISTNPEGETDSYVIAGRWRSSAEDVPALLDYISEILKLKEPTSMEEAIKAATVALWGAGTRDAGELARLALEAAAPVLVAESFKLRARLAEAEACIVLAQNALDPESDPAWMVLDDYDVSGDAVRTLRDRLKNE